MMERLKYHDILYNDAQLGPYPDHLLKRVDKPYQRDPGAHRTEIRAGERVQQVPDRGLRRGTLHASSRR